MDQYAVIGNPVSHSRSPSIHKAFAEQTGEKLNYQTIHAEEESFEADVRAFFSAGGKGLNVTLPFKERAMQLAEYVDEFAQKAGAANTLYVNENSQLCCSNTDGIGLRRDICENHHIDLKGKKILILGAGGAVRGVLGPLLKMSPNKIVILNRTLSKAQQLQKAFDGNVLAAEVSTLNEEKFDVIINGTSASLHGKLPELPEFPLREGGLCYDMMYAPDATVFMQWGVKQGAALCLDGRGMLVEQAAESFKIWRGVLPETQDVLHRFPTL